MNDNGLLFEHMSQEAILYRRNGDCRAKRRMDNLIRVAGNQHVSVDFLVRKTGMPAQYIRRILATKAALAT